MPAITIRNLSDSTHLALKKRAAAEKLSVEALVRRLVAAEVQVATTLKPQDAAPMTGFSESPASSIPPPGKSAPAELWGAMQGTVHIPPGTDLTAPLDEVGEALS